MAAVTTHNNAASQMAAPLARNKRLSEKRPAAVSNRRALGTPMSTMVGTTKHWDDNTRSGGGKAAKHGNATDSAGINNMLVTSVVGYNGSRMFITTTHAGGGPVGRAADRSPRRGASSTIHDTR